ncbi:MAG: hypothetical protein AB7K09_13000 [Planctomycetota bacterium]
MGLRRLLARGLGRLALRIDRRALLDGKSMRMMLPPTATRRPAADADPAADFFLDGFVHGTFQPGAALDRVVAICNQLHAGEPREGYEWATKYQGTRDLRPDVFGYDPAFVDLLFEQGLAPLFDRIAGPLTLGHIQLRQVFPTKRSYMPFHRDSYVYQDRRAGFMPPGTKLIFYPLCGAAPADRLTIVPGSPLRMFHDSEVDAAIGQSVAPVTIQSSDSRYVFFNVSAHHHAVEEHDAAGSIRVIYSFVTPAQASAGFPGNRALHDEFASRLRAAGG